MSARANPRAIHVVDDDPNVLESLILLLRFMGHQPLAYNSARDFLSGAQIRREDVFLFDLHMPDMDGFALLRHIRQAYPEPSAILMTGHGNAEVERDALHIGFWAVLHKPFSEAELAQTLTRTAPTER